MCYDPLTPCLGAVLWSLLLSVRWSLFSVFISVSLLSLSSLSMSVLSLLSLFFLFLSSFSVCLFYVCLFIDLFSLSSIYLLWLSKSTLLSRSSGLVREHLVQGFSLSSTQRWLAYSVAVGTQQFGLCCLGSFLGNGMPMYLFPLKYSFWL
jgi:hypothetical protein